jgi:hypothetical protein
MTPRGVAEAVIWRAGLPWRLRASALLASFLLFARENPASIGTQDAAAKEPANRLAGQPSAYLASAAYQPVHWFPWGEAAFRQAQTEDKPILLDIGAVWCHWCHVMDREDYENPEIAALINRDFVAVKVDRDERPDIDRRYQLAVRAVGGSNGWPLTAFLTPTGEVFFGGTYFPPDDGPRGAGFRTLLPKLADVYHGKKKEIFEKTADTARRLAEIQRGGAGGSGRFSAAVIARQESLILDSVDWSNGGFSRSPGPKFPNGGTIDFLLARYVQTGNEKSLKAAALTLEKMAEGGIHDRVGGGFHRYSTDMFWRVPHFEKMAYDQAALLENSLHAYQVTGSPLFREAASGIVDYVLTVLFSPAGGFYAFQDADVSLHDDGSYFTWTREELARALSPEKFRVVEARFGIVDRPDQFPELPDRQVLAVRKGWDEVTKAVGLPEARCQQLLKGALENLRKARSRRKAPFVDETLFADSNGMLISAMLDAWRVLGREDARKRALDSYDFVVAHLRRPDGAFLHAYGKGLARVEELLADQVWMADAAIEVYQARGRPEDLSLAKSLLDRVWTTHRDAARGGLFDLPPGFHKNNVYLSAPAKSIEDNPTDSPNAVAIRALEKLAAISGEALYARRADELLNAFAEQAADLGSFGGAYALAGAISLEPGAHVVIVGARGSAAVEGLYLAAFRSFRPGSTAAIYPPGSVSGIPAVVASQIEAAAGRSGPLAFVCVGTQCALPTADAGRVSELARGFGKKPSSPGSTVPPRP